jgi:hypothetical protein
MIPWKGDKEEEEEEARSGFQGRKHHGHANFFKAYLRYSALKIRYLTPQTHTHNTTSVPSFLT